jgi:tetratricopeptide (TPR) repeat protein/transcriptional regulator with XRE-family HTH domain
MASGAEPGRADSALAELDRVGTVDELAELLRRLRRRHARTRNAPELTVRELARLTGYAYGAISEYLSGKALAPTDRFDVLVRLLGANATEQRALATARDRVAERRRGRRAPLVPRQLPADVPGFTGREAELAELDRLLAPPEQGRGLGVVSAVAGTAGVGKTALAVHWAHRVADRFPDGCLYVDLRGYDPDRPVPAAAALAAFLRSLDVVGREVPAEEDELAALFRTLTAQRRMLVVLDNARDSEQVRPLLPGGRRCVVVVTSRDALTGLVVRHGACRLRLDPLPAADAVALLGALIGQRVAGEAAAAAALAQRCVRLPLALRLVAELAATRPGATLAELDAELADVQHRLDRLDAGGEPRTATRAVLSWSYQHLPAPAARAFRLAGAYPGHDLDAHALAALAGTGLAAASALLAGLARAHLVRPAALTGRVGVRRYGMHDLLRAYAAELAAADPEAERLAALDRLLAQQLHACTVAMDLVAPFDRDRRPAVPDPGWPAPPLASAAAATRWLDTERCNLVATAVHAAGHGRPEHAATLAAILLRYLDTGAHHQDAELLYDRVVATGTPAAKAHALTSLGIVCWRLGRYQEAVQHQEHALRLARQLGDRAETGRALTGLGILYWQLGRTADTVDCGRQAVELYRAAGDRLGQARVTGNLGTVHGLLGDYRAAAEHHRRALRLFVDVGDPAGMSNELGSLAHVCQQLGRLPAALDHAQRALALARDSGYRESEAQVLGTLGSIAERRGQLAEALAHHRQSLELLREIGDRAAEGYALGQLGSVHERLGRVEEAVELHHQALGIAAELGDEHLTAELLNRLGGTLLAAGRAGEALCHHDRALAITRRTGNRYQQARAHHGIASAATGPRAAQHHDLALALYTELGVPEAAELRAAAPALRQPDAVC